MSEEVLSRDELKTLASGLGIEFAPNIPSVKLQKLIDEAADAIEPHVSELNSEDIPAIAPPQAVEKSEAITSVIADAIDLAPTPPVETLPPLVDERVLIRHSGRRDIQACPCCGHTHNPGEFRECVKCSVEL